MLIREIRGRIKKCPVVIQEPEMSFPRQVAESALLDCSRCCCICHEFCGPRMELHHIVPRVEGGKDTYENCIPKTRGRSIS